MSLNMNWVRDNSLELLLGMGTAFTFFWLFQFREKLRLHWAAALVIAVFHTIAGVLCVKAFAVLETGFDSESVGNMSLFGGVFFMPVLYFVGAKITKRKAADVFDIFTVCMLFTLMCARINCILSGCCYGVRIWGTDSLNWPTRELEIIFYVILMVVVGRKVKNGEGQGRIYPFYMISYGIFRFVIEWFRYAEGNSLIHRGHIWAVISLCIGWSIYAEMQTKQNKVRR